MSAAGAKSFCLIDHFSAFATLDLSHLVWTVACHTVSGRRKSGSAFQLGAELSGSVMTSIAIDVICQLVVEVFGHFLTAFVIRRRWQRSTIRNVGSLKMTASALFHFLSRCLPRRERQRYIALRS